MNELNRDDLGWLIRDTSNVIRGPYSHAEIQQLLKKGQLKPKTEIARANSYWFAVEEKAELEKFFPEVTGRTNTKTEMTMTATLTEAVVTAGQEPDNHVDITQFTPQPTRKELKSEPKASVESKPQEKMQWLSDEFAEEFGGDDASMGLSSTMVSAEEKKKLDALLQRATVKADTLPSEYKESQTERPKAINTLIKHPTQKVPADPAVKAALEGEEEEQKKAPSQMKKILLVLGVILIGVSVAVFVFLRQPKKPAAATSPADAATAPSSAKTPSAGMIPEEQALRRSLVLYDFEQAKAIVSQMELTLKVDSALPMARAIIKKEFLYDSDGAIASLENAMSLAQDSTQRSEIHNMLGIYLLDRDTDSALQHFHKALEMRSSERLFRYNLAVALMRLSRVAEAQKILTELSASPFHDDRINYNMMVALGWIADQTGSADGVSENFYKKALELDPLANPARLLLAVRKLKRLGPKESELDFRLFLESMPELDGNINVINYRALGLGDYVAYARAQIREYNSASNAANVRPSPVIMGVDGMLSAMQGKLNEAEQIVQAAMGMSTGNPDLTKAFAYIRYKSGRVDEVQEMVADLASKQKSSFAVNLLLSKTAIKAGKSDAAERYLNYLASLAPERSDVWSSLGDLQRKRKAKDEAKKNYLTALSKNETDLKALQGLLAIGEDKVLSNTLFESYIPF